MFGKPAGTGLFGNNNTTGGGASTGLFGKPAQPGLFGANNNNNAASNTGSTGLFGANNNNNNNTNTNNAGGLFGANGANNKPLGGTSTGGLFASNNNTNASTSGSGLFGNNTNSGNNAAGATGGGLFGAKPAAPAAGGLFGAKPTAPATAGGLFGNNNQSTSSTLGSSGGGLFGNKPTIGGATNTGTGLGGGLFGSNNNNTTNSGMLGGSTLGSGFGGNTQAGTTFGSSTLGGGLFGSQQQMQQQQQQPQSALQSISQLSITPMTRIADFPPQIRAEIEQLDQYIQKQVQISEHLKADDQDHNELISSIPRDIAYLSKVQSMTMQSLQKDLKKISKNKELTDSNLTDTQMFAIILQQILTPGSKISSMELEKFFQNKIAIYQAKLDDFFRVLSDIESAVNGIHCDIFGGDSENNTKNFGELRKEKEKAVEDLYAMKTGLNAIISTVIEEFKLFMSTADQIAALHQQIKVNLTNK